MTFIRFRGLAMLVLIFLAFITVPQSVTTAKEKKNVRQQQRGGRTITEGFQLSLQAEKGVMGAGDAVILKLALKNASQQTLSVKDQATWYDYEVDVRDEFGQKVTLTEKGKQLRELREKWQGLGYIFRKIEPQESVKYTIDITGLYEFKAGRTYFITVSRKVQKREGQGTATVTSNTIEIKTIA